MRGFFKTFPLLAFLVFSILFLCFWLYALIFTLNRWDERTIGQNLLYLAMTIIFGGFWGCYCVHQTPDSENEEAKKM
jgi:fatty acid desaturase